MENDICFNLKESFYSYKKILLYLICRPFTIFFCLRFVLLQPMIVCVSMYEK